MAPWEVPCWIYYDVESGCELFKIDDDVLAYGEDAVMMSTDDYADYQRVRQEHRAWQDRLHSLRSKNRGY